MKKLIIVFVVVFTSCSTTNNSLSITHNSTKNQELNDEERKIIVQILEASLEKFEIATQNLSEEQLFFKVKLNKWSIAECIEHVALAEIRFPEIVQEEMKKPSNPEYLSKIKIKDEKIRPKMLSRIWKAKSPEVFKPSGKYQNPKDAIIAFKEQRLKTINYIRATKDDLRNHFWKHPLTGTIDLYQTFILMSAHLERHIEQMEKIKKDEYYPS